MPAGSVDLQLQCIRSTTTLLAPGASDQLRSAQSPATVTFSTLHLEQIYQTYRCVSQITCQQGFLSPCCPRCT
jgi:hypothetical protein